MKHESSILICCMDDGSSDLFVNGAQVLKGDVEVVPVHRVANSVLKAHDVIGRLRNMAAALEEKEEIRRQQGLTAVKPLFQTPNQNTKNASLSLECLPFQNGINDAILEAVRKHSIAVNVLTEQQAVTVIKQAFACGDLMRHVRFDNGAQYVTYEPFRREEELKARITKLENDLKDCVCNEP